MIGSVNYKALGLSRIVAGLVLALDTFNRGFDFVYLYTDEGPVTRAYLCELFGTIEFPSIYFLNGTPILVGILLVLQILAGLALAIGYRTRQTTFLCWFLLTSLNVRNPAVLNGGDWIFQSILFWAIFLPWGKARTLFPETASGEQVRESTSFVTLASVGLTLQMFYIYSFAVFHKLDASWLKGEALALAFQIEHVTRSTAVLFAQLPPSVLSLGSRLVLVGELSLALTILCGGVKLKRLAIICGVVMHVVFGAVFSIGVFAVTPIPGLLALWPAREKPEGLELGSSYKSAFFGFAMLLAFLNNLDSLGEHSPIRLPLGVQRASSWVGARQNWALFSGPSLRVDGWGVVKAVLDDGTEVDLTRGGAPLSLRPPKSIRALYKGQRTRRVQMTIHGGRYPGLARQYTDWLIRKFEERHPGRTVEEAEYIHFVRTIYPDFRDVEPDRQVWYRYQRDSTSV